MTDKQFIKRMVFLTEQMCDLYNAEPIDQNALHSLRIEIHETGARFNRSRRRRPWFLILVILFWLLALVILVSGILLPIQF